MKPWHEPEFWDGVLGFVSFLIGWVARSVAKPRE